MSRLKWFVAGIGLGILAVKQLNENPKARKAFDDAIATAKEFGTAVADGFVERETELKKPAAKPTASKTAVKKSPARKPAAKSTKTKSANK
ncbi:MAG: hypothetical protein RIS51_311 [Actinomycetota bacterium]